MDGNYEWQKHQTNERIQQRLQEAQAQRQAKEANGQNRLASGWTLSILLGVGIIVVVWLLAGCTPISQISAAARVDAFAPRPEVAAVQDLTSRVWSMAERIRFQDRREAYLDWHTPTSLLPK